MSFPPGPMPPLPQLPEHGEPRWDLPLNDVLTQVITALSETWYDTSDTANAVLSRGITPVNTSPSEVPAPVDGQICYVLATRLYMRYDFPTASWVTLFRADGINSILNGPGDPGMSQGSTGDFWLNTTSYVLFGPKTEGVWGPGTSLIGPKGIDGQAGPPGATGSNGNTIYNGGSDPVASLGANGDFYLNTATATLFGPKRNNAWPVAGTLLIGPRGTPGAAGPTGATGPGVATGGSQGQWLNKKSGTDFDTEWGPITEADVQNLTTDLASKVPLAGGNMSGELLTPAVTSNGITGTTGVARLVGGTATNAPTSGTFNTRDFIITTDGHILICTAGGSPGTWRKT